MSNIEENAFQIARYLLENPQEGSQVAIRNSLRLLDEDFRVALKFLIDGHYCKTYGQFGGKDAGIRQKNLAKLQDFINRINKDRVPLSLDAEQLLKFLFNSPTAACDSEQTMKTLGWDEKRYLNSLETLKLKNYIDIQYADNKPFDIWITNDGRELVKHSFRLQFQQNSLISQADYYYYAGEYPQAISLYEKVITLDSTNERANIYLIKAKQRLTNEENRARLPQGSWGLYNMAISMSQGGKSKDAIETLMKAIDLATLVDVPFPEAEELLAKLVQENNELRIPTVFISYSRADSEIATDIYFFLRANNCIPWLDRYSLTPGQDWEMEIRRNIKDADFFLACLSNNSVSKRGYVQKELKYAISILDEFPEGEIYLIPIRIDDCVMPESLANRHWLDWSKSNAKDQLIKAIKSKS